MGAVLPKANDAKQFWQNVLGKVNAIVEVPPDRWDASVHYDPDPSKEDKTYTKIGGFITDFRFDPLKFRIPPSVAKALDPVQQMALAAAAEALEDAGYDKKAFDRAKCAVILGNSLGGERKDETNKRMHLAEFTAELRKRGLATEALDKLEADIKKGLPSITEDTMPGELSNVIAGRLANVLNLGGKNLTTDAACASSHAALDTAVKAILGGEADMVLCGGADRSMDPGTYVKFCKIGALSPNGSTPFDARADGFVMGEGVAILLLKRLSDAVRDGDKIYCVVRGMGSSSDGKGKGITAPNPEGQKLAVKRAFQTAEVLPRHVQLMEAHGTSTKVGDVVEVESISALFEGVPPGSVALGSVKSQIGHLKSAAGAAGVLKAAFALKEKVLPPSINFQTPNPNIKWGQVPFYVNTEPKPWPAPPNGEPRRAAVSAFGFGGTNFHVILEEYVPSYHGQPRRKAAPAAASAMLPAPAPLVEAELVVLGADSVEGLVAEVAAAKAKVPQHATLEAAAVAIRTPRAHLKTHRLAVGADSRATLAAALDAAQPLLADPKGRMALPLKVKSAIHGEGPRPEGKVAFLFPGQGSQYANMCGDLARRYPVVRQTFDEADAVLEPLLGRKLTSILFVDVKDKEAVARAEEALKQTEVTQPAMLAADVAILRLLEQHGVKPNMVAGHSLGEYAALVAAGVLSFKDALLAVSARGKEMANVHVPDKGLMASFSCGPEQAEAILRTVDGYVVAANKNCPVQTVIAGETAAVHKAMEAAKAAGVEAMLLPVSAAFHTSIVAPASAPLRRVLDRLDVQPPRIPVYTNVDATPYPGDRGAILDILSKQVAAPVEWVAELNAMHEAGARIFIEVGPKRALAGFVDATLGKKPGVVSLVTNHPKTGDIPTFFQAIGRLAVMGFELGFASAARPQDPTAPGPQARPEPAARPTLVAAPSADYAAFRQAVMPALEAALQQGWASAQAEMERLKGALAAFEKYGFQPVDVVVSGASMGLPGQARRVFSDDNADRLFAGENRIDRLDARWAERFIEKELVRLVKDAGEPRMEKVQDPKEVLKLAGRRGDLDLETDYFVPAKLVKTLDVTSKLAIAAAYEALHDAGIPMVRETIVTTTGKTLPGDWVLPPHLQDDTGIVFASAFPGYDNFVQEVSRHLARRFARRTLGELDALYHEMLDAVPADKKGRVSAFYAKHAGELHRMAGDEKALEGFNRHFLFSILSLGHAELAETISARGPNTQVNAACSSSTQAIAIAEDWLRAGRAKRVIVVGADDVTSDNLLEWIGSGFLVSGAATTAGSVEEGALPFDRRRHGMIIGMGAVGLVLERREDVEARGMVPVARLVATRINNSAYHGSRLHVDHIAKEARVLVETAARRLGTTPEALGPQTLFVSHETYTPARGGSASAEAAAMRQAFGSGATKVLVTNTKGFTGHPMGAGVEDALAVKALQFGKVPPIANLRDTDPEFADLNLSRGGTHDRRFAMRFSAGFGSQLAMAFFEKMADGAQRVKDAARHQAFLDQCAGAPGAKAERVGRVYRITTQVAAPTRVPVTAQAPEPIATP
ncbi:MAG TPA: beta-ketoacyl synthase N-terminal-like domain-containing protein, partial [Candidatus Thermoplasmatota archaeon]|nr:beta-ketoacyl synthase N-terminal-like domain-containing protein [Candidatus Thermoplasmatota archaeon]